MKPTSIKEMARDLLAQYQPRECLELLFGTTGIRVLSNSVSLIQALKTYFSGFETDSREPMMTVTALETPDLMVDADLIIKEPEPGKSKIKEEYLELPDGRLVRKRLTGMVFLFGDSINLAIGPSVTNDNQVINFINSRLIQRHLDQGALLAHAAAVSLDGKGLALAGFSGAGKSTLALHMMSRGSIFVSNDRLLIEENHGAVFMQGVPKLPRINPGTALNNPDLISVIPEDEREEFMALSEDKIWGLEHKYDVFVEDCFGRGRFKLAGPMHLLVILNWKRGGGPAVMTRVDLNERRDLLTAVMKPPGLFWQPSEPEPDYSEETYLERLKPVPVFEFTGGVDFKKAAEQCLKELEKC
jgi:HprK-related kinase B